MLLAALFRALLTALPERCSSVPPAVAGIPAFNGLMTIQFSPAQPTLTINDGTVIPQLGFGTWELGPDVAYDSVRAAISTGFRRIDTAMIYGNEKEVGEAIRDAIAEGDVDRQDLVVSTKVWNSDQGFEETLDAFEASFEKLGLEYIDLYFIHWPVPALDRYKDTYKAMMRLQGMGRIQSLAVCNFYPEVMDALIAHRDATPGINQIELHPGFSQAELREYDKAHGIITESWTPLGKGTFFDNEVITRLAEKYGKTPAQVILRWHLDLGLSVLTRSSNPVHIKENFDVLDFALTEDEVAAITALDGQGKRLGPDPLTFGTPE